MAKMNKDTEAEKKEMPASKAPARGGIKKNNLPERLSPSAKVTTIPAKKTVKVMAKKAKSTETKIGIYQKAMQFLREAKIELKKVTWPTRKETIGATAVVLVLVMILSLFLGVVDMGFTKLITLLIR